MVDQYFLIGTFPTIIEGVGVLVLGFLFCYGYYLAYFPLNGAQIIEKLRQYLKTPKETDVYLLKTGMSINSNQWMFLLLLVSGGILLSCVVSFFMFGGIQKILFGCMTVGGLLFFMRPQEVIFKKIESPFIKMTRVFSRRKGHDLEDELYTSLLILKNLAIAQEDNPLSANVIFEKLEETSTRLRPIYAGMLAMYNSGEAAKAFQYFAKAIGTRNGKTFALTLEKVDKIPPTELKYQVMAFQEAMSEERYTKGLENAQAKGNTIYLLATVVCFIILINFVVVCVFMDAIQMLGDVFS